MYIVAIAWLYVAILMAVTETSFVAGVATFLFYGLGPLLLFWWVVGARVRKQRRLKKAADQAAIEGSASLSHQDARAHLMPREIPDQPDQSDPRGDQ